MQPIGGAAQFWFSVPSAADWLTIAFAEKAIVASTTCDVANISLIAPAFAASRSAAHFSSNSFRLPLTSKTHQKESMPVPEPGHSAMRANKSSEQCDAGGTAGSGSVFEFGIVTFFGWMAAAASGPSSGLLARIAAQLHRKDLFAIRSCVSRADISLAVILPFKHFRPLKSLLYVVSFLVY